MLKAYLELLSKGALHTKWDNEQNSILIGKSHTIIGRDEHRSDICLLSDSAENSPPMSFVSGIHCTIFYDPINKGYVLVDNYSRNGTRLDGQRLKPGEYYILSSGARIELGAPPNNGALLMFHTEAPLAQGTNKTALIPPIDPTESIPTPKLKPTRPLLPHVFLSHSSQDNIVTQGVYHHLIANPKLMNRLDVWLDRTELQVGEKWSSSIENAIRSSLAVVVMVSQHALDSRWVMREISVAVQHEKPFYVVQIGEVDPKKAPIHLHEVQWVNLLADYHKGIVELVQELSKLCE